MRLTADVPGRIAAIYAKEGEHVERGTTLAEIENGTFTAEVALAQAAVDEAQAELQSTMKGARAQDVSISVNESIAARAKASLAKSELERDKELAKSGSVATAELDDARHKFEAARAESSAAWARAVGAQGSRRNNVLVAEARLRAMQARLDQAKSALLRTMVVAPTNGEVLRVKARVGEFHNPGVGEPILVIGDMQHLRVRLDIDERDVARMKIGTPAYLTAPAFGGQRFTGKVVDIARRMGRRNVRVDDPIDRVDVKILEVLLELDEHPPLIPGLRVEGFVGPT
jgi:multidrug resistance efflux pump